MKKIIRYGIAIFGAAVFIYIYLNADSMPQKLDDFIKYFVREGAPLFTAMRTGVLAFIGMVEAALRIIPPYLAMVLVAGISLFASRKIVSSAFFGAMLLLIYEFGYWELMVLTVAMIISAVIVSLLIGVPIGILMSASRSLKALMNPILDTMQTMPAFVYLIPAVMLFKIGKTPGFIATVIYALPPLIRLTSHAISQVDADMREAARAFGATKWQSIFKVEIPQALPTIMAGVNQTTMMAVAMVVTSALVGTKGLGEEVLVAMNRVEPGKGFIAGASIVFVAIIIDRITQMLIAKANARQHKGGSL